MIFFKKEFKKNSPVNYIILPNGVEIDKFKYTQKQDNFVLTYLGQFNKWKNIDLIFSSFSLLDEKFTLKIAGGKGDRKSIEIIEELIKKYNIDKKRVNYLGFIKQNEIVKKSP
ncbi:glycosyltransferase [Nitrosophilus labii]|uniref:glycosyltransferase n=1 Tax=Nitrosophilus labii TaxID=2706014 RepID=UPI0016574337|nr:glycosyltransferase [Nitrosophilus labii]